MKASTLTSVTTFSKLWYRQDTYAMLATGHVPWCFRCRSKSHKKWGVKIVSEYEFTADFESRVYSLYTREQALPQLVGLPLIPFSLALYTITDYSFSDKAWLKTRMQGPLI